MKKVFDENNPESTIVHVVFRAIDNEEYECVGVLMKKEKDMIQVAFNTKNNKVIDYLDIKRADVISIDILDSLKVGELV